MFNWLGNLFPYSDLHSLNLDWLLSKMKETAAQAAKAIADSANALAQVIEAKTAAQNAQTAAQNAQTAANNAQTAADNAATSAENAVTVAQAAKSVAQTAQNTADAAKSAAQTAQNTAQTAQSAAQTAQSAAQTAQSAAQTAQTAADDALSKFPVQTANIADFAITSKKINTAAVTVDKIDDRAVTASKIANGAVTNEKMPAANFFVGVGSYSLNGTATASEIAAGNAVLSFSRAETRAVIFVVYSGETYNVGDTSHQLFMYSEPFIITFEPLKRVIDITLADLNTVTGENTEYKGTATLSVSTSRNVSVKVAFAETLPFSDDIGIPYGIKGLSARPI